MAVSRMAHPRIGKSLRVPSLNRWSPCVNDLARLFASGGRRGSLGQNRKRVHISQALGPPSGLPVPGVMNMAEVHLFDAPPAHSPY